jgi:hypothetical protein
MYTQFLPERQTAWQDAAEMRNNDWNTLIWSLQRQNCILFLGPAINSTGQDNSPVQLTRQLTQELASELGEENSDPNADLPTVAHRYSEKLSRTDLSRVAQSFYQAHSGDRSEVLTKLAALPFYLAVTSCHDELLASAFREQKKTPQTEFYNFRGPTPRNLEIGSIDRPLIYQLYGSVEDPNSLVLTDFDLIDFLVAIVSKDPPLPQSISAELQKSGKSLLFLGFGMKQWYLRILLHVLRSAGAETRSFALEALDAVAPVLDERTILFYKKGYRIEIFNDDSTAFVQELHNRYIAAGGAASKPDKGAGIPDLPPPKVFLSYSRPDREFVGKVYEELRKARLDPWMDQALEGGEVWSREIEERVRDSDYFLVFQSQGLANRTFSYVNTEVRIALERQRQVRQGFRYIIPLQIDDGDTALPELTDIQSMRLRDPGEVSPLVSVIVRDYQRRVRQ